MQANLSIYSIAIKQSIELDLTLIFSSAITRVYHHTFTMPTVLILGAGANIGLAAAKEFADGGYKVAIASRNPPAEASTAFKHFVFDAANPETVPKLFQDVTSELGTPSVVIFNGTTCSH
jgi:NAD(P)-dependent dehydrogenase (short-subunit alcohol dehydrogenase family)